MDSFSLSDIIPATPAQIFRAWLTGAEHAAFTGSPATAEPMPGTPFMAWDGFIEGTTLELEPGRRILQTWRTTEFPTDSESSLLEVLLVSTPEGTRVTLNHNRIPDGQGKGYLEGWKSRYFVPMKRHFGGTPQVSAAEPKSKPAPRRSPAITAKPAQALKANAPKRKPTKVVKATPQPKAKAKAKKVAAAPKRKPARKAARAKPTPRRSR